MLTFLGALMDQLLGNSRSLRLSISHFLLNSWSLRGSPPSGKRDGVSTERHCHNSDVGKVWEESHLLPSWRCRRRWSSPDIDGRDLGCFDLGFFIFLEDPCLKLEWVEKSLCLKKQRLKNKRNVTFSSRSGQIRTKNSNTNQKIQTRWKIISISFNIYV